MHTWIAFFLPVALAVAALCWWVVGVFWFERVNLALRVIAALVCSFFAMLVISTVASLVVHIVASPGRVWRSMLEDPPGALSYFYETGMETGALWLPVLVLRIILLGMKSRRDLRKR